MKVPEGYALVKISEVSKLISNSLRAVMVEKQIVFAELSPNSVGGSEWSPLYRGQDRSERILHEMGNNAGASVVLSGADLLESDAEQICLSCDHTKAWHEKHRPRHPFRSE